MLCVAAARSQPDGALAPPVAEEPPLSLPPDEEDFSELFSDSLAEVPPEAPLSEDFSEDSPLLPPEDSSLPPLEFDPPLEPVEVFAVVAVVEVEVEVVSVASRSAEVSFGGVTSGVLLGTGSDTLLPPQALNPRARSRRAPAASAVVRRERPRRLTRRVAPSADRRSGSR